MLSVHLSGILPLLRATRGADERLYAVHRLDRVTSGLLMVAKTPEAARAVSALLRERKVEKFYVALSARKPEKPQRGIGVPSGMLRKAMLRKAMTSDFTGDMPSDEV